MLDFLRFYQSFKASYRKGIAAPFKGKGRKGSTFAPGVPPPPACGPDSRLELCVVDGMSFPHHSAHRTVPGTQ